MFEAGYGISTISYNLQRSEVAIYQQIEKQDLYCDKTRLNQVLLNLLSNAIKFTPAGGTVSVRLRQLPGTRSSPDFHGKHILLAEDNELNREIAVEILSKYGFIFVSQISLTTNP